MCKGVGETKVLCEWSDMQEEAKDAFKELLTSVNAASDWTWEHAMRLIISDPRYLADMILMSPNPA